MILGPLNYFLGSSTWHTKSFFKNDFEVSELLLKWFWGGLVTAKMISGGLKSMLEKWFQGVTVPDHPRIISEMIWTGGEVQPPEGRGDGNSLKIAGHFFNSFELKPDRVSTHQPPTSPNWPKVYGVNMCRHQFTVRLKYCFLYASYL